MCTSGVQTWRFLTNKRIMVIHLFWEKFWWSLPHSDIRYVTRKHQIVFLMSMSGMHLSSAEALPRLCRGSAEALPPPSQPPQPPPQQLLRPKKWNFTSPTFLQDKNKWHNFPGESCHEPPKFQLVAWPLHVCVSLSYLPVTKTFLFFPLCML